LNLTTACYRETVHALIRRAVAQDWKTKPEKGDAMSELTCLELSVVLWVVHMLCQVLTNRGEFGDPYLFSSRDERPTPKGLACGRAERFSTMSRISFPSSP